MIRRYELKMAGYAFGSNPRANVVGDQFYCGEDGDSKAVSRL